MGWEAWLVCTIVVLVVYALARELASADLLLIGGLTIIILVQVMTGTNKLPAPKEAILGFGNDALVSVGALFVVVAGLTRTGAMSRISQPLIGQPKSVLEAQLRLLIPVTFFSSFLNNTPVVAMFMPVVADICKKTRISPSQLYLPLSHAATFGGICTVIGTSTNLVVNGMLIQRQLPTIQLFELSWVGVPCAICGLIYMMVTSRWLLPHRQPAITLTDDPRQYTVEMVVEPNGPLVGQSIEQAGLRHLPGLYLMEIDRGGNLLQAVTPQEPLQASDRLIFVGILESVVDLQKRRGLISANEPLFQLDSPRSQRRLIEAVVSPHCPLIGQTIRDGQFRTQYNAAILAVARGGKRVAGKIGDIVLLSGDTLLIEADRGFLARQRNSNHFFLVSNVENGEMPRFEHAGRALTVLIGMVTIVGLGWINMLEAAMAAACAMICLRCCSTSEARRQIDWSVLLAIGGALGIGKALEVCGAANVLASQIIGLAQGDAWWALLLVYLVTMLLTELVTNNAAAALMFPLAIATAQSLGVQFTPFAIAIMVSASAGYSTPFGYQTNLMVYTPGGYTFADYLRFGIPLNLLFMFVTVVFAPLVWPFQLPLP